MKHFLILLLAGFISGFAQTTDFNTKNGFMAKGYDVVAYFSNEAIEGNDAFITTYNGVKFQFISQQNLNTFLENPEAYIPQYGGFCAYAVATKAKKIDIDPKTFEIRDKKLYLFYNSWFNNTLIKWNKKKVKGLQQKADKNWEAIKFENSMKKKNSN